MEKQYMRGSTGNTIIDGIIRNIYEFLNKIVDQLNSTSSKQLPSDAEGTLRIVKQSDNTYIVAVKSSDGWLISTGFRFQTKLD
jgi:archaeosine-15-forming tRNA-guanine transglycosylase